MGEFFISGVFENAENWRDADAADEKNRRLGSVFMQAKRAVRTGYHYFRIKRQIFKDAFKSRISYSSGDSQAIFIRRGYQREKSGVAFIVRFRRIDKGNRHILSGDEIKACGLLKIKNHRPFGDFLFFDEFYFINRHTASIAFIAFPILIYRVRHLVLHSRVLRSLQNYQKLSLLTLSPKK